MADAIGGRVGLAYMAIYFDACLAAGVQEISELGEFLREVHGLEDTQHEVPSNPVIGFVLVTENYETFFILVIAEVNDVLVASARDIEP